MTDPDAPSREKPTAAEWLHYLVINISGIAVDQGETVAEYIGAAPPAGTGLHRYIFLVFEQKERIDYRAPLRSNRSDEGRSCQNTRALAQRYGLGTPIAGNCFQAEFDAIVPKVYEQLSEKI